MVYHPIVVLVQTLYFRSLMVYHPIVLLVQTYFHSFNGVSSYRRVGANIIFSFV